MNTSMSTRIAEGVTATYLRDISRHSAPTRRRSGPSRAGSARRERGSASAVRRRDHRLARGSDRVSADARVRI